MSDDFVTTEPDEYRIELPDETHTFTAEEWAEVIRNLHAMQECIQRLAFHWSTAVINFRRAWLNDPVVTSELADLRSKHERSRGDGHSDS